MGNKISFFDKNKNKINFQRRFKKKITSPPTQRNNYLIIHTQKSKEKPTIITLNSPALEIRVP